MKPKPLLTFGGIVVALIVVVRIVDLPHLSSDKGQLRLTIFLAGCAVALVVVAVTVFVMFWSIGKQAKEEAAAEPGLRAAAQGIRERVIADGLATAESVDHYIRGLRQPEFKALMGEHTRLKRTHFR